MKQVHRVPWTVPEWPWSTSPLPSHLASVHVATNPDFAVFFFRIFICFFGESDMESDLNQILFGTCPETGYNLEPSKRWVE